MGIIFFIFSVYKYWCNFQSSSGTPYLNILVFTKQPHVHPHHPGFQPNVDVFRNVMQ